jgi:hypothetical protein
MDHTYGSVRVDAALDDSPSQRVAELLHGGARTQQMPLAVQSEHAVTHDL